MLICKIIIVQEVVCLASKGLNILYVICIYVCMYVLLKICFLCFHNLKSTTSFTYCVLTICLCLLLFNSCLAIVFRLPYTCMSRLAKLESHDFFFTL